MVIIGHCANCNEYYGHKYASLADWYNDESTHNCREKDK